MPSPDGQEGIKAANGYTTVQCCTPYSDPVVTEPCITFCTNISGYYPAQAYTAIVAGS
jgi:hypothetical protein